MTMLLRLLALLLIVTANAFFVAAEFALVSVRETRIQQLIDAHRVGARTVRKLQENLDQFLAAVQLGVTMASLGLGWLGEATLAQIIQGALTGVPHAAIYAHAIAVVAAFAAMTYVTVVLGELVPKGIALQRAERVALAVAGPMDVFVTVTRPFLSVLAASGRVALRLFGAPLTRHARAHSSEELRLVVTASGRYGAIPKLQQSLILRALEMGDVTVREIMVGRPNIISIPADMPLPEALGRVVDEQHSRVPVYDSQRGPEHIIGLLYSKDVSRWMRMRLTLGRDEHEAAYLDQLRVRDIMRDVLVVPETKPLPDLLVEFKERKRHLAVVVDEFGSTSGVVTVEDVLEQVVGEIEDEFDIAPQPLPTGSTMVLEGSANIRDLETHYGLRLPRDGGFETLAGFVLAHLQRMPRVGDGFEFGGRRFTVIEMDGLRIARMKIEQLQPVAGD